jgi:hypothetical protein
MAHLFLSNLIELEEDLERPWEKLYNVWKVIQLCRFNGRRLMLYDSSNTWKVVKEVLL